MEFKRWLENDVYFHGSPSKFMQFDYAFIGEGADQEGPGFYFTNNEKDARRYIKKDGKTGKLYKAKLKLNKTVPLEGRADEREVRWLMEQAPDLQDTLMDWGEDPREAFAQAFESVMTYTQHPHDTFQQVWYDYYHRHGADEQYLKNMVKLGYDGVIIPKENGVVHVVVFSPDNIELIEE